MTIQIDKHMAILNTKRTDCTDQEIFDAIRFVMEEMYAIAFDNGMDYSEDSIAASVHVGVVKVFLENDAIRKHAYKKVWELVNQMMIYYNQKTYGKGKYANLSNFAMFANSIFSEKFVYHFVIVED